MSLSKEEIEKIMREKLSAFNYESGGYGTEVPISGIEDAATAIHDGQQAVWYRPEVDGLPDDKSEHWIFIRDIFIGKKTVLRTVWYSQAKLFYDAVEMDGYAPHQVYAYTPVIIPQPPTEP